MKLLLTLLVGVAVVATSTGSARAEDRVRARQSYRDGSQHYDLGEYREALAAFKEAYRNFEDPTFLFNIGQCHRQLGEKEPAVRFYRTFLIKVPEAPNAEEVRKTIATLEKAIADERSARFSPPQGTLSPGREPPAAAPQPEAPPRAAETPAVTTQAPAPPRTPVYKKWWLWTIVGVVVAGAAVGAGVGIALSQPATAPSVNTDLGTYKF